LSFMSAIADAKKRKGAVSWRDREYIVNKTQNPLS
jgi:hypothetical protein